MTKVLLIQQRSKEELFSQIDPTRTEFYSSIMLLQSSQVALMACHESNFSYSHPSHRGEMLVIQLYMLLMGTMKNVSFFRHRDDRDNDQL